MPTATAAFASSLPRRRRGWQRIGRIRLWSEYPFGLFHVWSWLNPDFAALIYPRLETGRAAAAAAAMAQPKTRRYAAPATNSPCCATTIRPIRAARSPGRPARATTRLLVKEFEQRRGREIALDWNAHRGLDYEARISRLARWVCDAEAAQVRYVLRLPGRTARSGPRPRSSPRLPARTGVAAGRRA